MRVEINGKERVCNCSADSKWERYRVCNFNDAKFICIAFGFEVNYYCEGFWKMFDQHPYTHQYLER